MPKKKSKKTAEHSGGRRPAGLGAHPYGAALPNVAAATAQVDAGAQPPDPRRRTTTPIRRPTTTVRIGGLGPIVRPAVPPTGTDMPPPPPRPPRVEQPTRPRVAQRKRKIQQPKIDAAMARLHKTFQGWSLKQLSARGAKHG
ncbi:TPA: hypothetical protein EYM26_01925, partial [Candidatus Poribacteria bacterium]|nr:hypothetical protein [Candidatus Poribacteria bacterium]